MEKRQRGILLLTPLSAFREDVPVIKQYTFHLPFDVVALLVVDERRSAPLLEFPPLFEPTNQEQFDEGRGYESNETTLDDSTSRTQTSIFTPTRFDVSSVSVSQNTSSDTVPNDRAGIAKEMDEGINFSQLIDANRSDSSLAEQKKKKPYAIEIWVDKFFSFVKSRLDMSIGTLSPRFVACLCGARWFDAKWQHVLQGIQQTSSEFVTPIFIRSEMYRETYSVDIFVPTGLLVEAFRKLRHTGTPVSFMGAFQNYISRNPRMYSFDEDRRVSRQ